MTDAVQHIVITGASSGLGAALAVHYAAPGITLSLTGRNAKRLEQTADLCGELGAVCYPQVVDVCDADAMQEWLCARDDDMPIDLVIANAGISAGTGGGEETASQARMIFNINMDGVFNTISPIIPRMVERRSGQIALMSSLVAIRGLPSAPAYSASKSWVRTYGQGLRGWLGSSNVKINVICPGPVKTPMTDINRFPMPLLMPADKAVRIIARGIAKNKGIIAFPLRLYILMLIFSILPSRPMDFFFSRLPAKPSMPR